MRFLRCTICLALCLLGFTLAQCSELSGITTSDNTENNTDTNPDGEQDSTIVGDNIVSVDISDDSIELDLDLAEGEEAMLLIVATDENHDQHGFQVANSVSSVDPSFAADFSVADQADTEDAHAILRDDEEYFFNLNRIEPAEQESMGFLATSVSTSEKTFKVIQSFSDTSQYISITTTLIYEGDAIALYLDDRDVESLSEEQIDHMIDIATDYDQNIAPKEAEYFGETSDVDDNGIVYVVATREVNEYYNIFGAFVTGYFYAGDTFSTDVNSGSNEAEVVFTIVPDSTGTHGTVVSDTIYFENIFEGVITHELQHNINFNERYLLNGASTELPALNEAMSHLAEDLLSDLQSTNIENYSRVSSYLSDVANTCLFCSTSLKPRGGSYLFLRYLYEHANKGHFNNVATGKELLQALLASPYRGEDNLKYVLFGDINADAEFANWFSRFGLAMYLSDTDLSDGDYYQFEGLNLRAIANDNRGTYLNGPSINDLTTSFTGTLEGVSMAFIKVEASDLDATGSLTLNFEETENFSAYLVK